MSNHLFNEYFKRLDTNSVLLTPNRRLTAVLHDHYIQYQARQNLQCWQKPAIISIKAWLENLWRDYVSSTTDPAPYLLNDAQASALWESIVSNDETHNLLQVAETAASIKSAWELVHQYEVNVDDALFELTDDFSLCQRWLKQYQTLCKQQNYIDVATLPNYLAEKVDSGEIMLPERILLYGFTEVVPQHERLIRKRCETPDESRPTKTNEVIRITLPDLDSEIIAMARFAKAINDDYPNATIGCVVLNLSQQRDRILQIFTQVFFPNQPFDIDAAHYPFNISAGKSLTNFPLIATALQITEISNNGMSRENFSHLLLSPYIGGAESESAERAILDAKLRNDNINLVKLSSNTVSCPLLTKHIKQFLQLVDNKKRSYHEWSQQFNNMLSAFGWPGEKSLSSEEYQVANAWLTALTDFASLDKILPPTTHKEAWRQLKHVLNAQIFQPQSPKTNIQVLGLLEAAAVPFDYLWIAGMNDISWPPQPNPHPYIPKQLQRQLDMPHATAERELNFCTTILDQFQQSATQIIFSHAESDGKIKFKPSSLLQHFTVATPSIMKQSHYIDPAESIFKSKNLESFTDTHATELPALHKIPGGADVIKQQAACAFRSFATHRLQARKLETSTQGLNSKDRGIILHDVMQRLWSNISTQEKLLMMDDSDLQNVISSSIDQAITDNAPQHHHDTHYIALEKTRLSKLIMQWLALEKSRPPFIVSTREESATLLLQDRELSVRIDRIDTLANGKKLIIDYKSGANNSVNKWFGDRPDEPQLPMYALIDPDNTTGISFAQLATGNIRFKGISNEALDIKGIDVEGETWSEKIIKWRNVSEKLAADFIAGDARVNPKRPSVTCKHCALTPFCRIHEITHDSVEDESSEESIDE